jgi:hypothetical protein
MTSYGANTPDRLIDGSTSTFWQFNYAVNLPCWVQFDLGGIYYLDMMQWLRGGSDMRLLRRRKHHRHARAAMGE